MDESENRDYSGGGSSLFVESALFVSSNCVTPILILFFLSVSNSWSVFGQQKESNDKQKQNFIIKKHGSENSNLPQQEIPVISKNKRGFVLSIKRVNLILNSLLEDATETRKINKYVEITVKSSNKFIITNSMQYFRIGVQEYIVQDYSSDMFEAWFMLTPEEFETLKDGDLIFLRMGGERMSSEQIKKLYDENGAPTEDTVPNFGRLDKKMINKFATVERNNVKQ